MRNNTGSGRKKAPIKKPDTIFMVSENTELLKFLLEQLPQKNRNNIKTLLGSRQVSVEGKPEKQFNYPLVPGQEVKIRWKRMAEEKKYQGITIIYEDDDIVIIDKHAGVLSIATDNKKSETAYNILSTHVKRQKIDNKIFVVHRLDRETSGLMMFAKSEKVKRMLQSNWNDIITERSYMAIVEGIPEEPEGTITSYLRESKALIVYSSQNPNAGYKAVTHYKVMKKGREYALLKINLDTGKKNQVRVHMQDIGHPVIGDKKYGCKSDPIGRLGLHAWVLAFRHPISNEPMRFKTPIPKKFTRLF